MKAEVKERGELSDKERDLGSFLMLLAWNRSSSLCTLDDEEALLCRLLPLLAWLRFGTVLLFTAAVF